MADHLVKFYIQRSNSEGLVKFFLQRLNSLSVQEAKTFAGLEEETKLLTSRVQEIGLFFDLIGNTKGNDDAVRNWVNEVRDLIYEFDDHIDEFVIQMDNQNGSDGVVLADCFRSKLEKMNSLLAETVERMKKLDCSTTVKEEKQDEKENFNAKDEGETLAAAAGSSTSSIASKYMNLPYYLQSCLIYCCMFPEDYWIRKGKLIRLLVAEGLTQEKAGKITEDVVYENITELIRLGMLQVDGTKLKVSSPYREFLLHKMEEDIFVLPSSDPDAKFPKSTRRVLFRSDMTCVASKLENLRPRSLILMKNLNFPGEESNWLNFSGAKFLRVIELEGTKIKSLPDEAGDLTHLKYLGLKDTDIGELPERLGELRALQTLDIRWCGNLTALPDGIVNLVRLRHLKMFKNLGVCGMKLPEGIGGFRNLLTLTGVHPGGTTARELGDLIQLRRLGVMDVTEEIVDELFASIMRMRELLCLSIEAKHTSSERELVVSETFCPPPFIKKLRLEGVLKKIPNWLGSMERLTKIRLGFSHLSEDPSLVLQLLPNLENLTLWRAYDGKKIGKEFCRVGGFPKLEILSFASHVLEEWTEIEEGALPSLKYLHLHNCLKLRMIPEGLQFVTTLKQLDLLPMLDDHAERLKPDGGEENHKIKHIPLVRFITMSMLNELVNPGTPE